MHHFNHHSRGLPWLVTTFAALIVVAGCGGETPSTSTSSGTGASGGTGGGTSSGSAGGTTGSTGGAGGSTASSSGSGGAPSVSHGPILVHGVSGAAQSKSDNYRMLFTFGQPVDRTSASSDQYQIQSVMTDKGSFNQ